MEIDTLDKQAISAGRCPFSGNTGMTMERDPNGCPVSAQAQSFDPFGEAYLLDPAEVLAWSREEKPIFYSPSLGYWVVTRYADVKEVFRNSTVFSPANALEKITPFSEEANEILRKHNYGMARTLVNEDEPAHMERRRALMHSFAPEELAHHEPMVRRLAREYVDRFVERGEADLVNEMFWEVPLTVALHFLGVPEEDMQTLRQYSIAHTVNTWGRPTQAEQLQVADAVGNFWRYAGEVLEKMRQDPSGHGWMKYAIRQQQELPEVVTDSYLHSMMMAGIVAAHETTAHAIANAVRLLLEDRATWDKICADPSLIPLTVEECLRHSGSIIAWRRVAMQDTEVAGVFLPKGSKVLLANASANHDERHFEDPDALDIYRDNVSEHLSFGYGTHQCLGKNLARMEMCVFLEELTKRLPHMRLRDGQEFQYLANVSFRGPEHLHVQWDPALNPEKQNPALLEQNYAFKIGPPSRELLRRDVVVSQIQATANNVLLISLQNQDGSDFPRWSPGAHIDVMVGEYTRKYSLCGDAANRQTLQVAILREEAGRGGSAYIHQTIHEGMHLSIKGPKNNFRLNPTAKKHVLVAGGIGITPILAMADSLKAQALPYELHYAGFSTSSMALLERVQAEHGHRLHLWIKEQGQRLNLAQLVEACDDESSIYVCGPERMIAELELLCEHRPESLHFEHFSANSQSFDSSQDEAFAMRLENSGITVHVPAGKTALTALLEAGVEVDYDCEEGLCGNCEVVVVEGEIEHRDNVLSRSERAEGKKMLACCSRAKGKQITVAL